MMDTMKSRWNKLDKSNEMAVDRFAKMYHIHFSELDMLAYEEYNKNKNVIDGLQSILADDGEISSSDFIDVLAGEGTSIDKASANKIYSKIEELRKRNSEIFESAKRWADFTNDKSFN